MPQARGSTKLLVEPDDLRDQLLHAESGRAIATLLDVTYAQLTYLIYRSRPEDRYETFTIPKRSGAPRKILKPNRSLSILQSKLHQALKAVYEPMACVHGFVDGKSIVSNASCHHESKLVLNVDIADFFPSINFGRARGLFMGPPFGRNESVATVLAQICCHDNELPQGAPTSPIVSNMICHRMDLDLMRLAKRSGAFYTRYSDDLTFSTSKKRFAPTLFDTDRHSVSAELRRIIERNGFSINERKVHLRDLRRRQEVTGVVVNERPNVRRSRVRQARAMLHAWEKWTLDRAEAEFHARYDLARRRRPESERPSFKRVLRGRIDFIGMVRGRDDAVFVRLHNWYCRLDPDWSHRGLRSRSEALSDSLWVLESVSESITATAFTLRGRGIVTCHHALAEDSVVYRSSRPSERYDVRVRLSEPAIDLAVLEIDGPIDEGLVPASGRVERQQRITVAGYPNHNAGDEAYIQDGRVVQFRQRSGIRRFHVDARIVAGNSGGPVLDRNGRVVGVAATGADSIRESERTEEHGAIPIAELLTLLDGGAAPADDTQPRSRER